MRVLVVDDERFNLKVAEQFLSRIFREDEIYLCNAPQEVVTIVGEKAIDIVLLDIVMPKVTGLDVLRIMRKESEFDDVQIIMLTSMDDSESFKACFELGANDFIKKPINSDEFYSRIRAAIKTRSNSLMLKTLLSKIQVQNEALKQVNATLKDAQFHLVQSEKMAAIGELAAGVAHEINNPIGYVRSNFETLSNYLSKLKDYTDYVNQQCETLKINSDNEQIHSFVENIHNQYKKTKISFIMEDLESIIFDSKSGVDKVAEIVSSLRNFARSGNEDEKTYVPVDEIIGQALLISRNEAKYTTNIAYTNNEIIEVYCNKNQIGQVVLNIVINGVQAIKSLGRETFGNIEIEVNEDEQYVIIKITDDGPGMSEAVLANIFNPFFTTKDVGVGTGLGLSISHDIIVNKHKGILDVRSKEGEGTTFIIKLPRQPKESIDHEDDFIC